MQTKKSCFTCTYENTYDKEGSYCEYFEQSLTIMFPKEELHLDEIGCLQWKKKNED